MRDEEREKWERGLEGKEGNCWRGRNQGRKGVITEGEMEKVRQDER